MARCATLLWSLWSLTLCSLPSASCYFELSIIVSLLGPSSSIVDLLPPETCNHTLFLFTVPPDNYSLLGADGETLAGPGEACLDQNVSLNGSIMIAHDYGDYRFELFAYVVDTVLCGNASSFYYYSPVICAYEEEQVVGGPPSISTPLAPAIMSLFFTSIGLICSSFLILTYSLFKTMRTLPGQTVLNLAVAFFASDFMNIVITSVLITGTLPNTWIYLFQTGFFHARFVWMAIVGFEISRHIYKGMTLKFDNPLQKKRMLAIYLAIGWGAPLLIGVVSVAVEFSGAEASRKTKLFAANGAVVNFVPIGLTLLFNVAVAIFLMVSLRIAAARRSKFRGQVKKETVKFSRIFIVILTVLGLTWFFMFLYLTVIRYIPAILYIFILLNMTQPIFVCVAFLGNRKTVLQYATLFGCRKEDGLDPTSVANHPFRRQLTRLVSLMTSDRKFRTFKSQGSRTSIRPGSARQESRLTYMSSIRSRDAPSPAPPTKFANEITSSGNKGSDSSNDSGVATSKTDIPMSLITYVSGDFPTPISTVPELANIPEYGKLSREDSVVYSNLVTEAPVEGDERRGGSGGEERGEGGNWRWEGEQSGAASREAEN